MIFFDFLGKNLRSPYWKCFVKTLIIYNWSLPHFNKAVTACRVQASVFLVHNQLGDCRVLVGFEFRADFASLIDVDHSYFAICTANCKHFSRLVESTTVSCDITDIDSRDFLDHADVPDFHDTVRISRDDVLTTNTELGIINSVEMAVESLHSQACSHVPNGQSLVGWTTDEEVCERLESKAIDRVCVRAILLPQFYGMKVKKFDCACAISTENEVSGIMEFRLEDGSSSNVRKRVSDTTLHKVPKFYAAVTSRRNQMRACWMEVNTTDPVLMTLSSHDVLTGLHVPYLPKAVITCGSDDLFAHM